MLPVQLPGQVPTVEPAAQSKSSETAPAVSEDLSQPVEIAPDFEQILAVGLGVSQPLVGTGDLALDRASDVSSLPGPATLENSVDGNVLPLALPPGLNLDVMSTEPLNEVSAGAPVAATLVASTKPGSTRQPAQLNNAATSVTEPETMLTVTDVHADFAKGELLQTVKLSAHTDANITDGRSLAQLEPPAALVSGADRGLAANTSLAPPLSTNGLSSPASNGQTPLALNTPDFDRNFSNQITWLVKEGVKQASLRLNPPELGPIEVRVNLSQTDATVNFVVNHESVRDAIEAAMPKLRQMLGEAGLSLTQANVDARTAGKQEDGSTDASANPEASQKGEGAEQSPDRTSAQSASSLVGRGLVNHYV